MAQLPDPTRSRAVLIGTGAYVDERIDDLPSVIRNVSELGRLLVSSEGTGLEPVCCVSVTDPYDVAAVLAPVKQAARQAEDLLLVYFAGHGVLFGRRDLYLAVSSTDPDEAWTAIPYTLLADLVRDSVASVKVVILDCCFSGRATAVLLTPMPIGDGVVEQVDIEGAYVMTSSPGTRESFAPHDSTYTVFTGTMLQVLSKAMCSIGGPLSMADLFERVRQRVKAAGYPEPQQYTTNTAGGLALVCGKNLPGRESEALAGPSVSEGATAVAAGLGILLGAAASSSLMVNSWQPGMSYVEAYGHPHQRAEAYVKRMKSLKPAPPNKGEYDRAVLSAVAATLFTIAMVVALVGFAIANKDSDVSLWRAVQAVIIMSALLSSVFVWIGVGRKLVKIIGRMKDD
jgi:hypothetical protein